MVLFLLQYSKQVFKRQHGWKKLMILPEMIFFNLANIVLRNRAVEDKTNLKSLKCKSE